MKDIPPLKMNKVLVAGLQDWNYKAFTGAISAGGFSVLAVNEAPAISADVRLLKHQALSALHRLWGRISPAPFFENGSIYHAMRAFDRHVAALISTADLDTVVLWSGMARWSLEAARRRAIRTFLVMGNSRLDLFEKRMATAGGCFTIPAKWKADQSVELSLADGIIVESSYVADGLIGGGIDARRIHILPPHVRVPPEVETRPHLPALRFCQVQPNRRKGVHLLASWWTTLDPAPQLLLIGHFDRRDLGDRPMPEAMRSLGHLTGSRYGEALDGSSVALFPTFEDGGPRAMIECMARALCVIASPCSAAPDHIVDGVNGFVIPLERADAWIGRIRWCVDNPEEVHRIGRRARDYVVSRLSTDHLRMRWNEILGDVPGGAAGSC